MVEFVYQVTAQYSNAVLVAILPLVSDFVRKVDLPMPTPIIVEQVAQFRCWPPNDGDVGGAVILTNGLWLWYLKGHVEGFRTPRSYYNLQNPEDIPRFYGPLNLDKDEALKLARQTILKLGYSPKESFTDQEPKVDMPPRIGTNVVPHYRFQWKDPIFGGTAVSIEVDAKRKMIQAMMIESRFFRRAPPRIAVESGVQKPQPISLTVSNQFLAETLPKVSEYARKLRLPLKLPVSEKQVQRVEFIGSTAQAWLRLVSGQWYVVEHGTITAFYSRDRVFNGPLSKFEPFPLSVESYLGHWKMSDSEAVALVRKSIERLGYTAGDFFAEGKPEIIKHEQIGNYVVPRYNISWLTNNPGTGVTLALAIAEVDANRKRLVSLKLLSERLFTQSLIAPTRAGPTGQEGFAATNKPPVARPPSNPFE